MDGVSKALLNFVLVSIPEETFLVCMTLIFLKRFDLLDVRMWKQNIKWLAIPVIPVALMINVFRYIIVIPRPIMTITNLIIFYSLMLFVLQRNSYQFTKKDKKWLLICFSLSFIMWGALEGITCPIILFLSNKPLSFFNNNIGWNFMLSIPSRIIGFMIVIYFIIKHNSVIKIMLFDTISKNKFLLGMIVSFAIISNIFSAYIIKLIAINKILENNISLIQEMVIIMITLIFPALILFWILLLVNYLLTKEKQIQQTYKNLLEDEVMTDVED